MVTVTPLGSYANRQSTFLSRGNNRIDLMKQVIGVMIALFTLGMSIIYMTVLDKYTQNDYFWTNFNASGAQTLMSDIYNAELWFSNSSSNLPLFSIARSIEKDYSASYTTITVQDTKARRVINEQLDNLPLAITGLRSQTPYQSSRTFSNYCWLDFDRQWEVAYTAKRQLRCNKMYFNNGAVYFEAMIRNAKWSTWYQMWGSLFELAFGSAIRKSSVGVAWLKQCSSAMPNFSIDEERDYWIQAGVTRFILTWQNWIIGGFDDAVTVKNVFGAFSMPLQRVLYINRGPLWTSLLASFGFYNGFNYASDRNASLIRNSSNSFTTLGEEKSPGNWIRGFPDTTWSTLLQKEIGTFAAIDLTIVTPPVSFLSVYNQVLNSLKLELQLNNDLYSVYRRASGVSLQMVPRTWTEKQYVYYGGNVFCYQAPARNYVQRSFGFDDACSQPSPPMTVDATKINVLLALWFQQTVAADMNQRIQPICAYDLSTSCESSLLELSQVYTKWTETSTFPKVDSDMLSNVFTDLSFLGVSLVQFALLNSSTSILLQQQLLDASDMNWSFYGWLHLLDWTAGVREVISLEGDENSFALMSMQYTPVSFTVDPLQTPTRFSYTVLTEMWYINGVFFLVTALAIACGMVAGEFPLGHNLIFMNQVVGLIWIGRPLLFLRGMTAIVILSTANIDLINQNGFVHFSAPPRSLVEIFVVSGETLWLIHTMNDILSLLTRQRSLLCTVISTILCWSTIFLIELHAPFIPQATLSRNCISINMDAQVSCVAGVVSIGSFDRFVLLCCIQIGCVIIALIISFSFSKGNAVPYMKKDYPMIIPAVATYSFQGDSIHAYYFDPMSSTFSGLIPFRLFNRQYYFSVLLWLFLPDPNSKDSVLVHSPRFSSSILVLQTSNVSMKNCRNSLHPTKYQNMDTRRFIRGTIGHFFLLSSAVSSAIFLTVTRNKLSNDFLWEGFNTTGMQAFLIDWYNTELNFDSFASPVQLNVSRLPAFYNDSAVSVGTSAFYASRMQFDELHLLEIIQGIRRTTPSLLRWISCQHCYLDFDRRWEVAHSAGRQERCKKMTWNGAVYVESILRNSNLNDWRACVGDAFDTAYFNYLRQSNDGLAWITSLTSNYMPSDEVDYWTSRNITKFQVQWQNYKTQGVRETLHVENAMGFKYPLTLKASNGTFRFNLQTSFKMYWGWGNDLWALSSNKTHVHGSLIRSSPHYAFQNISMEELLRQNLTIQTILDPGLASVRNILGPFGCIDMVHLPCPVSLLQFYKHFLRVEEETLMMNPSSQNLIPGVNIFQHITPTLWLREHEKTWGGSPLCPVNSGGLDVPLNLLTWFNQFSPCGSRLGEYFTFNRMFTGVALVAWGVSANCPSPENCLTLNQICIDVVLPSGPCITAVNRVHTWVTKYMANASKEELYLEAQQVKIEIRDQGVSIFQYGQRNSSSPIEALLSNLFEITDPSHEFFSWYLLIDWVLGYREVVEFTGDTGSMTLMSTRVLYATDIPNAMEIPDNLVYYCKLCIQYTTSVMFSVALITLLYSISCRGRIEGINMLEINRVAGIVWVGRPLLGLRSLAAICLLSTSAVNLEQNGIFTTISVPQTNSIQSISTILSGSEACWLVVVLSDLCMAFTKDYTNNYSLQSTILVTIVSIALSLASPVEPAFHLERVCDVSQIDFQIICSAGVVRIGNVYRLLQVGILTTATMILCFAYEKWRRPQFQLPHHNTSLLLPAGALYLYHKGPWIYRRTLYLDKASAFMCGLITFSHKEEIYLLDVKTWRTHIISMDQTCKRPSVASNDYEFISNAVPLVD